MKYVIYLSTSKRERNDYGYWSGKNYIVQGELFPITDSDVVERTKVYTSKKRAYKALESCLDRGYVYVVDGEVRTII